MKSIAIVGGGAAGLAAAIEAGERLRSEGCPYEITVYERDDRVGRSILATGNGRCNFSNTHLTAWEYRNFKFVVDALCALAGKPIRYRSGAAGSDAELDPNYPDRIPKQDVLGDCVHDFFERHGLVWREEADGRMFPLANKASVVLDVLRAAAANVGVVEACDCEVVAIEPPRAPGKPYTLRFSDGRFERADAVIVACGGRGLASLDACGIVTSEMQPVLGPLRVTDKDLPFVRELDNIRVRCSVTVARKDEDGDYAVLSGEEGELMFRKYGVSGICVFNLSRYAQPGDVVFIDFLQARTYDDAIEFLEKRRHGLNDCFKRDVTNADMVRGIVLPRVSEAIFKRAGIDPNAVCDAKDVERLASELMVLGLEIEGIADVSLCQVRRGGIDISQVNPTTMEVSGKPGLYCAGEALDVDGPCGGYNLHWAWASGLLAGRSAAQRLAGGLDVPASSSDGNQRIAEEPNDGLDE